MFTANSSVQSSRKNVTCYKCGHEGHYSDKCSLNTFSSASNVPAPHKNVSCYKCGHQGHYSDRCPSNQVNVSPAHDSKNEEKNDNTIYKLTLKLQGKWGRNSAFIHLESEFFKIKKALNSILRSMEGISDVDFDIRNDVPHIQLVTDGDEKQFDAAVDELEGREFLINLNAFEIKNDSISFDVGQNKHITLFYKKDMLKVPSLTRNKIREMLKSVLEPFAQKREEVQGEAHNTENKKIACIVCMENDIDCQIAPCHHVNTCFSCCERLTVCPSCRAQITGRTKIFIQHV